MSKKEEESGSVGKKIRAINAVLMLVHQRQLVIFEVNVDQLFPCLASRIEFLLRPRSPRLSSAIFQCCCLVAGQEHKECVCCAVLANVPSCSNGRAELSFGKAFTLPA
jgi:hypothetical protein